MSKSTQMLVFSGKKFAFSAVEYSSRGPQEFATCWGVRCFRIKAFLLSKKDKSVVFSVLKRHYGNASNLLYFLETHRRGF